MCFALGQIVIMLSLIEATVGDELAPNLQVHDIKNHI